MSAYQAAIDAHPYVSAAMVCKIAEQHKAPRDVQVLADFITEIQDAVDTAKRMIREGAPNAALELLEGY